MATATILSRRSATPPTARDGSGTQGVQEREPERPSARREPKLPTPRQPLGLSCPKQSPRRRGGRPGRRRPAFALRRRPSAFATVVPPFGDLPAAVTPPGSPCGAPDGAAGSCALRLDRRSGSPPALRPSVPPAPDPPCGVSVASPAPSRRSRRLLGASRLYGGPPGGVNFTFPQLRAHIRRSGAQNKE